jgi:hypothetical protein
MTMCQIYVHTMLVEDAPLPQTVSDCQTQPYHHWCYSQTIALAHQIYCLPETIQELSDSIESDVDHLHDCYHQVTDSNI